MGTTLDKIASEEAKLLKLFNDGDAAYCYRQDADGNATFFAYIMIKHRILIIIENSDEFKTDVIIMDKMDDDAKWNKNRLAISEFLDELFFRTILQQGTESEQKRSHGQWQICTPQSIVPEKIVSFVNKILKDKGYV